MFQNKKRSFQQILNLNALLFRTDILANDPHAFHQFISFRNHTKKTKMYLSQRLASSKVYFAEMVLEKCRRNKLNMYIATCIETKTQC